MTSPWFLAGMLASIGSAAAGAAATAGSALASGASAVGSGLASAAGSAGGALQSAAGSIGNALGIGGGGGGAGAAPGSATAGIETAGAPGGTGSAAPLGQSGGLPQMGETQTGPHGLQTIKHLIFHAGGDQPSPAMSGGSIMQAGSPTALADQVGYGVGGSPYPAAASTPTLDSLTQGVPGAGGSVNTPFAANPAGTTGANPIQSPLLTQLTTGSNYMTDPLSPTGPFGRFTQQLSPQTRALLTATLMQRGRQRQFGLLGQGLGLMGGGSG